jgi:ABC-type Fe3+ transport system permease subunit
VSALVAIAQWLRVRTETSALRIRQVSDRARIVAALGCLFAFLALIASVVQAFIAIESLDVEHRATALANGISQAMNSASIGALFVAPTVIIALVLAKKSRR